MKYQCKDCQTIFIHPSKAIEAEPADIHGKIRKDVTVESYICPHCFSLDITDYVEAEPDIVSVKSVDLAEVDVYLKDGYVVRELYAKTATLVKLSELKQPDYIAQVAQAVAEAAKQ